MGSKANIWLNIGLCTAKLTFFYAAIVSPITAYAGVFSFLSNAIHSKEADAGVSPVTSQTMGILEARIGPSAVAPTGGAEIAMVDGSALIQEVGVNGTQADLSESRSTQISLYVVRQGDSLSQIAKMFGVSVNTIVWANNVKGPIREGDELVILPISGVAHTVAKGDTIRSIATKYKADIDEILSYNDLKASDSLAVGAKLIIPDGEVKATPLVSSSATSAVRSAGGPLYKDYYLRPISGGSRSQGLHGLNAVDLAAPTGTPIYAAADGIVIVARSSGYNGGYGSYVVISHANGTQTLYAHMSKVSVSSGSPVGKGEVIGNVGNTGKSTGPHVHFEIRGAANPF
ncbi:MAG: peptidoglycan DD-metalloendopeptidase family protein [Candidatus Taylorbacteria bacterium]|nr:peptidoglycan DD-metalloendopeptidase family protein [Candidatus Taylorbacteria bacterium]